MIWFLKLAILLRGKNLARKALVNSSQVVVHPDGKECNEALALSLNAKGNKRWWIASVETPLSFNVSQTSQKTERCRFRSSKGVPPNWDCCTIEMSAGLSSKLLVSRVGQAMLEVIPWTLGVTKSRSVFLCSPHSPTMFVGFLLVSRLCCSIICFFLVKWRVLSISRSGLYKIGLHINRKNSYKHDH